MTVHLLKSNFSRGEVSPKVFSRVDLDLYEGGAERVRNFYNLLFGGLRRRSGTRYAGKVKTKTSNIRFVPFVYDSTSQAYVLEFGDLYVRFWTDGGQLVSSETPVEVTTPYTSAQIWDLQFAQTGDTMFIAHKSHMPKRLVRASNTSWSLTTVPFVDGPYMDINDQDNKVSYNVIPSSGVSVTFTHANTNNVNGGAGFSSTDVGRLYRAQFFGVWVWGTITTVTNTKTIVVSMSSESIIPSPTGISNWNTLYDAEARSGETLWCISSPEAAHNLTTADVGKVVMLPQLGGQDFWCKIEAINGANSLRVTVIGTNSSGVAKTTSWRLGAFSATTGYPGCVCFYEGRLVWANTPTQPRTLFFSVAYLPYNYAPSKPDSTVTADAGFYPTILAGLSDQILWLVESQKLQVGMSSCIRTLAAADSSSGFSQANLTQKPEVLNGATKVRPVQVGEVTVFVERSSKALRNMYFSFEQNTLVGPVFSALSDHLLLDGVAELAYQQVPDGIIWARTATGNLIGCTYNREEKVLGFHRHDFGGSSGSTVETIAVIPAADRDVLYMVVNRTIDGTAEKYVEVLDAPFEAQDQEDAFFVDCGATYDGSETSTVSGLDFLEGETVSLLADGAVLPDVVVTDGEITLPNGASASKIQIGLKIVGEAKLLRPPHQQRDGIILGRRQKAANCITEVIRTGGLRVGIDGNSTQQIRFRKGSDLVGQAPPLADGPYRETVSDSWENGGQIYYYTDAPLPAYIRSVLVALDTEGT